MSELQSAAIAKSIETPDVVSSGMLGKVAKEYGIFGAMVCFFIYWSYAREGELNKRIDASDAFIRDKLVSVVETNTAVLGDVRDELRHRASAGASLGGRQEVARQ